MKLKFTVILITVLCMGIRGFSEEVTYRQGIEEAITRQITIYPKSTLIDIYKLVFQDKFGPGHMISDTASASAYLKEELNSYNDVSGTDTDILGFEGKYIRVNLSVVKKGKVSFDRFLKAFIESANKSEKIDIPAWRIEWLAIEDIISTMNVNILNYENDKDYLDEMLKKGNVVVHHSDIYKKAYNPHYRVIRTDIWEALKVAR